MGVILPHLCQKSQERFEIIKKNSEERLRGAPEDKNGRYLPVANKEKAFALVQKKYDQQIAKAAGNQIIVLDRFLRNYDPDCLKRIYEVTSDVRKDMIMPAEIPDGRCFIIV